MQTQPRDRFFHVPEDFVQARQLRDMHSGEHHALSDHTPGAIDVEDHRILSMAVDHERTREDRTIVPVPVGLQSVDIVHKHSRCGPTLVKRNRPFLTQMHVSSPAGLARACGTRPFGLYVAHRTFHHRSPVSSSGFFQNCDGIRIDPRNLREGFRVPARNYRSKTAAAIAISGASKPITRTKFNSTLTAGLPGDGTKYKSVARVPTVRARGGDAHEFNSEIIFQDRAFVTVLRGVASCQEYCERVLRSKPKSSARSCRALHVCADLFSGTSAKLFSPQKQPRIWPFTPTAQCARRHTKYQATASHRQNQSRSSAMSLRTTGCRLSRSEAA